MFETGWQSSFENFNFGVLNLVSDFEFRASNFSPLAIDPSLVIGPFIW